MPSLRLIALLALVATPALAEKQDASSRYKYGQQLYDQHRYNAAIRAYQRALSTGGDRVILYDLGRAQEGAGQLDDALASYQAFLRAAPMSPMRFEVRGHMKALKARKRARALAEKKAGDGTTLPSVPSTPAIEAPAAVTAEAPARNAHAVEGRPAVVTSPPPVVPAVPPSPATSTPQSGPGVAPVAPTVAVTTPAPVATPPPTTVPIVPPVDGDPLSLVVPPPRTRDPLQLAAAGFVLGGAAIVGGGVGCLATSVVRSNQVEQSVRFDPALDSSGQRYQVAGATLSVVGVAALLIGGELIRRHAQAETDRHEAALAAQRRAAARQSAPRAEQLVPHADRALPPTGAHTQAARVPDARPVAPSGPGQTF